MSCVRWPMRSTISPPKVFTVRSNSEMCRVISAPSVPLSRAKRSASSDPWFFTSGYPISEAYWARVKIANTMHDVLIQPYERLVLTYVPANAPAWRVQMGKSGQHYVDWRYHGSLPSPLPTAPPDA